jgi:hypothetical protein
MELRPGEFVLWDGRVCQLKSLRGARAQIQETIGDDIREVPVSELRGIPSFTSRQLDQRLETLREVDPVAWTKAQQREAAIRKALQSGGSITTRIEAAAKTLGVSSRTVRRFIARYTASAQTTSLIAHLRGQTKVIGGSARKSNE